MTSINHFIQNRPVHLARRDIYFQAAAKELKKYNEFGTSINSKDYNKILFLLKVARMHAKFGVRTPGENENDEQFSRFVTLLTANAKAILSMLELRDLALKDAAFSFLGANQTKVELLAEEYQKRAHDTIKSLVSTLNLAEETFERLKKDNAAGLSKSDLERYQKACIHVEDLIKNDNHQYAIAPTLGKLGDI